MLHVHVYVYISKSIVRTATRLHDGVLRWCVVDATEPAYVGAVPV